MGRASDHSSQITDGLEQVVIPQQQVFWSVGRPPSGAVGLGPVVCIGNNAAMLCQSAPACTPRSSSSPSTTSTNCSPRARHASAASVSDPNRCASLVALVSNGG